MQAKRCTYIYRCVYKERSRKTDKQTNPFPSAVCVYVYTLYTHMHSTTPISRFGITFKQVRHDDHNEHNNLFVSRPLTYAFYYESGHVSKLCSSPQLVLWQQHAQQASVIKYASMQNKHTTLSWFSVQVILLSKTRYCNLYRSKCYSYLNIVQIPFWWLCIP